MNTELTGVGLGKLGAAMEAMLVDEVPSNGGEPKKVRTLVTVWLGTARAEFLKKQTWTETVHQALLVALERHARHKGLLGFDSAAALEKFEPLLVAGVRSLGLDKEIERKAQVKA